jgi:hypothetical protein
MLLRSTCSVAAVLFLLAGATSANARITSARPLEAHSASAVIEPLKARTWNARAEVEDTVLRHAPVRARAAALRTESFTDPHGHVLQISTAIDGLDLGYYAQLLAGVYHHDEIEDVRVEVDPPEQMESICGVGAVACYLADDPDGSYEGELWIPSQDPDLQHIITHEYGHHVDNQLPNLADFDVCSYDNDGSRDWFFEREVEDHILKKTGCSADTKWQRLLGELYAEDFTWLNGNRTWVMPLRSPTSRQLSALRWDFDHPLESVSIRRTRYVRRHRIRTIRLTVRDWRFLTIELRGSRAADLDLFLYARSGRRPLKRSAGRASREHISTLVAPGRYDVVVYAFHGPGRARLAIDMD